MILTAADKAQYFPDVQASGAALTGLLITAQALCESRHGAGRLLELQTITESRDMRLALRSVQLSLLPVAAITTVELFAMNLVPFNRSALPSWTPTLDYLLDGDTGELHLSQMASRVRISYQAGYDFAIISPATMQIKSLVGQVVTFLELSYAGRLDSYLNNPENIDPQNFIAAAQSWNYQRLDIWLSNMLLPLRVYLPRPNNG